MNASELLGTTTEGTTKTGIAAGKGLRVSPRPSSRWIPAGAIVLFSTLSSATPALANVHDTFGVGSAQIGMGNAQTAAVSGGAAAYYNPAGLARKGGIILDAGIQGFVPRFPAFEGIVYDRNQNGVIDFDAEGNPETTEVSNNYPMTMGMGINAALGLTSWMSFGLSLYMPTDYLMRIEMGDPYIPYYPLYKSRTQKFSTYAGAGFKVFDGLYIGVGASMAANAIINGRVTSAVSIKTATEDENGETEPTEIISSVNIDNVTVALKGSMSPTLGVLLNFGWIDENLAGLNVGMVYRQRSAVKAIVESFQVSATGDVSLGDDTIYSGPLTAEPISVQNMVTETGMNPTSAAFGASYTWKEKLTLSVDANWTEWSKYQEDLVLIPTQTIDAGGTATITVGGMREVEGDPGLVWHDTVAPRIGVQWTSAMPKGGDLGFTYTVRAGYGYTPSPVPEQTERLNMMDSNKHVLSGGLGFQIPMPRLTNPLRVDLFGSLHKLEDRLHSKALGIGPNEYGQYPAGYPVAGSITSGGSLVGFGGSVGLNF